MQAIYANTEDGGFLEVASTTVLRWHDFFVFLQKSKPSSDQAKAPPTEALVKLAKKRGSAKLTAV